MEEEYPQLGDQLLVEMAVVGDKVAVRDSKTRTVPGFSSRRLRGPSSWSASRPAPLTRVLSPCPPRLVLGEGQPADLRIS